jgi:flagellin
MSMVIGTNISSLTAQRHLTSSRADMEQSMERLASGKRINSSQDDAAGLAISHKLESKITGLNQGIRNANDGVSMLQTAEGALEQTSDILNRMKELATQASSGTYSTADRNSMDLEFQALLSEVTRISDTTDFNGTSLLKQNSSATFVVGDTGTDTISINLQAMSGADLGIDGKGTVQETSLTATSQINTATAKQAQTFTMAATVAAGQYLEMEVNGTTFTQDFTENEVMTGTLLAEKINQGTDNLTATFGTLVMTLTSTADGVAFETGGLAEYAYSAPIEETSVMSVTTENSATGKKAATFTMAATVLANQTLEMEVNGTTYTQAFDTSELITGGLLADQITNGTDNLTATFGTLVMTLTSTVDGADFSSTGMKERADGSSPSNLLTAETSTSAMSIIDTAIARVDSYRSTLGAVANRLDHTVSNLMNRVENQSAANSRILDADYAVESANLAKAQVLQQAGTAMLAQANASGQGVLSLLK